MSSVNCFETPQWFEREQKDKKERLKNALEAIFKDVELIQNGWDGDLSELEATKENIELIANELNIKIEIEDEEEC